MQLKQTHLPIHNLIVAMLYSLIAFVCHNLEIAQSLLFYDELDYALKATGNITFVNVRKAYKLNIEVLCNIKHRLQQMRRGNLSKRIIEDKNALGFFAYDSG